jgi:hypothetical protein
VVFEATDTALGRNVALKWMHVSLRGNDGLAERFLRGARSAARIEDRGAVTILDIGVWEDHLYIVMELLHGHTLDMQRSAPQLGGESGESCGSAAGPTVAWPRRRACDRLWVMVSAILLAILVAAPAPAAPAPAPAVPSLHPDRRELGRLWLEQSSALTWPGLHVPAFTLVPDRRRIHGLTLGLDLPGLRGVSFDAMMVEPSDDPEIRRLTARMPTGEGSSGYGWVGMRVQIPNSRWQLQVGRSWVARGPSAIPGARMGRVGGFQVNFMRRW